VAQHISEVSEIVLDLLNCDQVKALKDVGYQLASVQGPTLNTEVGYIPRRK